MSDAQQAKALRDGMAELGFIVGRNPDGVDDSVEATLLTVRELKEMAERTERAEAAARELGTALRDALELADEGWAYASEYFHTKWGYGERRAAIVAVIDKFPGYGGEESA